MQNQIQTLKVFANMTAAGGVMGGSAPGGMGSVSNSPLASAGQLDFSFRGDTAPPGMTQVGTSRVLQ